MLVSACLLGRPCRYDGCSKAHPGVAAEVERRQAAGEPVTAVCPEELGELGTPRPAAELRGGDGHDVWGGTAGVARVEDGTDVTESFRAGAERAMAREPDADRAILKARSPSCGVGRTWQDGTVQEGDGVFAALLRSRGVSLQTEEDLTDPATE